MKPFLQTCLIVITLLVTANKLSAQAKNNDVYLGAGMGLDYGGLGLKLEYLPIKYLGVSVGAGYNIESVGANVGAAYKILPNKKLCPNLVAMYGYNGVFATIGQSSQYDMVSYGVTFGTSLDITTGKRMNKLSVGLLVPIRSKKFRDNYEAAEKDPRMSVSALIPVGVCVGFNFNI